MKPLKFLVLTMMLAVSLAAVADEYQFSGPYEHKNLSVFFIHGKNALDTKKVITLAEALKSKKARVHETGSVGRLSIENRSDETIFVQSGDIVKGGKQDRTISMDMVLPPKSGKIPIDSFCVEQSRWHKRGGESAQHFSGSSKRLVSKKQKLAAKLYKDQSQVWSTVAETQEKMGRAVNKPVKDSRSQSSLQLTLENKDVEKNVNGYVHALKNTPNAANIIGVAYAINGKLNNADIYASNQLFQRVWPRLLNAAATEALMETSQKDKAATPSVARVKDWFKQADKGVSKKDNVNKITIVETKKSKRHVRFDTMLEKGKTVVHRNYMTLY